MTPRYIQWTIPSLLYQTSRKNSLVHKGLMKRSYILLPTAQNNKLEPDKTIVNACGYIKPMSWSNRIHVK